MDTFVAAAICTLADAHISTALPAGSDWQNPATQKTAGDITWAKRGGERTDKCTGANRLIPPALFLYSGRKRIIGSPRGPMNFEVLGDSGSVAERAASVIADCAWEAIAARGLFIMAVSGGHTPWIMLRRLTAVQIPWRAVHIVQVDERIAPAGHTDRNITHLRESLLSDCLLPPDQLYAMPVESPDLEAAAGSYEATLRTIAGELPVIDLVHLGLGPDGHTASLVPGDPVLEVDSADVALSGPYQGRRRMTLTYPILNRARRILWVVTGGEKAGMVSRLLDGDPAIPAGRVSGDRALLLADSAAAGQRTSKTGGVLCA